MPERGAILSLGSTQNIFRHYLPKMFHHSLMSGAATTPRWLEILHHGNMIIMTCVLLANSVKCMNGNCFQHMLGSAMNLFFKRGHFDVLISLPVSRS